MASGKSVKRRACFLFCLVFTLSLSVVGAQQELTSLVSAIESRYNSMGSFTANFVQIYRSLFSEEQESGVLYVKKPGKMRWEYTAPTEKLFVADGRKAYFYVPRDKQVSIATWQPDSISPALLFLSGQGNLKRDFDAVQSDRETRLAGGDVILLLRPKTEQASYKEIVLEVRQSSLEILRLSVIEHSGNRNDFLLRSFQYSVPIAEEMFRFKVPKGVEVVSDER